MCKHDNKDLIGTSEGIKCRVCGRVFKSYAEIEKDRQSEDGPTNASEALPDTSDKAVKEITIPEEKPVKEASDAKSAKKPAAKAPASKTSSSKSSASKKGAK